MKINRYKHIAAFAAVLFLFSMFALPAWASLGEPATQPSASPTPPRWETDPVYDGKDLEGNAELVEAQTLIFSNAELDFFSVSTKQGNIFYVLIDKRLGNTQENVYFLNKVDDADLAALLAEGEDGAQSGKSDVSPSPSGSPEDENDSETSEEKSSPISPVSMSILAVCAVALFAVWFLLLRKKPDQATSAGQEDEDEYEE